MENLLKQLEELRERILSIWKLLDIDRQIAELVELKAETGRSDFWNDRDHAIAVGRKVEELESETNRWTKLLNDVRELEEYVAVANEEGDTSIHDEAKAKLDEYTKILNDFEFFVLFDGKYDKNNAIVSVHAGTGGTEAQDWAEMLERMLMRFAEKRNWSIEIVDRVIGNEAGIKSTSFKVSGRWAYGYLKSETGVHRLVRISPFDAEQMRHTSFALVEVIPEIADEAVIEIRDEDLEVDTFRSSGPGGQNVNKTESAIRIKHKPTNIVVSCQSERSQHQNREMCMNILRSKLALMQEADRAAEEKRLKGDVHKAEWGKQIRSYVMQPYQMVKDHRTEHETSNIRAVLDGDIAEFMESYLRYIKEK